MRRILVIGLAALVLCGARRIAIHNLSPADAERLLAEGDVLLLDVRPAKDYEQGHVPGARSFPAKGFGDRLRELPRDRTQPVLVYDANGSISMKAAHTLYNEGYKDVYDLVGGLRAWVAAQKPIQVPGLQTTGDPARRSSGGPAPDGKATTAP